MNKKWEKEELMATTTVATDAAAIRIDSSISSSSSSSSPPSSSIPEKVDNKSMVDKIGEYVPIFVLGFMGMSMVRSVGDAMLAEDMVAYGIMNADEWKTTTKLVGNQIGGHYLLGTAMAAVGMSTSASALKGVGPKPFFVGASAALCVAGTAFTSVTLLSSFGVM